MKFASFFVSRLRAFKSFEAWFMIIIGLLLYTSRVPLPEEGPFHLPMAVSVLQVAGLMFLLCGLQIFISILMWPNVKLRELLESAEQGNIAAGVAACGLMLFNGMTLIAQVMWLIHGTGSRLGS